MSEYIPDCWKILSFNYAGQTIDKILSGWYGGYANGDSWRLSSGIKDIIDSGDHYTITNESGSIYQCYKESERISGIMAEQINHFEDAIIKHNEQNLKDSVAYSWNVIITLTVIKMKCT